MIALSFRIKLLLAMMLLVAGVSGATLYVMQQKVQETYLKLFEDQFETEVNYFTLQQENRLNPARLRCHELATNRDFQEVLLAKDPDAIYKYATGFLMPTNTTGVRNGRNGVRAAAGGGGVTQLFRNNQTFFRVLDANGEILNPPDSRAGMKPAAKRLLKTQLAAVQDSMSTLEEQPVGYLAPERTNEILQLLEVIVTKVADPESQKALGALVLGVPFAETGETDMNKISQGGIQSGVWLENQLHSRTIPPELRTEFTNLVASKINAISQPLHGGFNLTLGGMPRRAFFKLLNPHSPFPPAYQVSLYSMASAYKTEQEMRWQILAFSSVAMITAMVLSLLIAHGLSIPLRELVEGTEAVRGGNLQVKVPVRSRDEIGQLAASFNEMAEGLAQKELYRTVLNMVADEKIAHALMNGQLALGGEVREISVLFCDIRGFTAMTENMPPERVIEMLNEHMTALTRIVKEHHGVLDKFVGDLLMAIFGAPVSHENETLNAARCSLRLIQERQRLNETSLHQLQIGVSIATGKMVAGCMGSVDRLNYTVLGERVNLASRLCSQAMPGQVVIDQTTCDQLGDTASTVPLPALNLKGFSENVVAYELKGIYSWDVATEET